MPWTPPGPVDDLTLARLPFPTAQRLLAGPVLRNARIAATCEWHGQATDPELESFVMVKDGVLSAYVGERLRVTYGNRMVYAYCHRSDDLDDELSLTRRLFAALAPLDTAELRVIVEVVA